MVNCYEEKIVTWWPQMLCFPLLATSQSWQGIFNDLNGNAQKKCKSGADLCWGVMIGCQAEQ